MSVFFEKLVNFIRAAERYILVVTFLTMVVMYSFNVLIRELSGSLASSFTWIEEAVLFLNIFLVFLGLGTALEKGKHVSISTIRDFLPYKAIVFLRRLIDLVGVSFSVYLVKLSYGLMLFVYQTGQVSPTLNLPMAWIYLAPVVGFSLLGFRYLLSLFGFIDRYYLGTRGVTVYPSKEDNPSNHNPAAVGEQS